MSAQPAAIPPRAVVQNVLNFQGLSTFRLERQYAEYVAKNGLVHNLKMVAMGNFIRKAKNGLDTQELARQANVSEIVLRAVVSGIERFSIIPDEFWERVASALDVSITEFPFPATET